MKRFDLNRKSLSIILCIVVICIFTISIAYAALSVSLNITGNADVVASTWDVHFDNVKVVNGSVTNVAPIISDGTSVNFSTELNIPGDYFRFNIDAVNDGSIDAMIESVVKVRDLTDEQKNFISFDITYSDGVSINEKQLLTKGLSKGISVEVKYRKDITVSDLPNSTIELDLEISLIYSQADTLSVETIGGTYSSSIMKIESGDLYTIGSEICVGKECFYVMDNDGSKLTLFAKYNLNVGYDVYNFKLISGGSDLITPVKNPTGIQEEFTKKEILTADFNFSYPWLSVEYFSSDCYWSNSTEDFTYVFNSNSIVYNHLDYYKTYLNTLGLSINDIRLIDFNELIELGCDWEERSCLTAPEWLYSTSYWAGTVCSDSGICCVGNHGVFGITGYKYPMGVRPVIEVALK